MINLVDYRTEDAFPSEMKTASRCAAAYAFDQEKRRILEAKKRVLIWASLENVPDDKLDVLAVENRVLFYNSGLDPSIKRQLIQNSIYWYMKLGTRQAMEEMIDIVFQNDNSSVEEWYTYAGALPLAATTASISRSGTSSVLPKPEKLSTSSCFSCAGSKYYSQNNHQTPKFV